MQSQFELEAVEARLMTISNRIHSLLESSPNLSRQYAEKSMLELLDDQNKLKEYGTEQVEKVIESAKEIRLREVRFLHVESDYYAWPLWKRSI